MCGLCGALGSNQYWTDAAGSSDFQRNGAAITRREERERRVMLINQVLHTRGLALRDWGGNSYLLEGSRGNLQNVYNLAGIWSAVDEHTSGPQIDPLDADFLDQLEARTA
jgi:hypothetical protein